MNNLVRSCGDNQGFICPALNTLFPQGMGTWVPLVASLADLVLILVVGLLLRKLAQRIIDRVVRRAASTTLPARLRGRTLSSSEEAALLLTERRKQRAETMGSVLKHIATVVIIGTTLLTILSRLSIPIAPLLTSVGIIGVAVGFGAQELVKDFIAGMFMLLEDQYGVGDVIDVGPAVGTVEAVTLRITRLRDLDGRVWYVRNGTITRVGNESQGWSRAAVDVPVAYDADVPAVRELLQRVAAELWEDPEFRDKMIVEEPQVFGIEQISDTAMIFRVSAKTLPAQQAAVARELRIRVKSALDQESIPLAAAAG
ncbi:small conductance mechanosensitive channel [Thermocatellispora tengchongensis]|uniref:Small conductance mechanosensitive channel n=1 Tax=Thermocatellispora tengchongensis TaxID=1073253 RepID=A0A840PCC8_9ACTN|nr:mechanosensitive ion channel family protein [Thermocatellispora tengchongensis]MBB5136346.1 small conductance mechanosensitive channel [Thermocatellispora tengchongensis]